MKTLIATLLIIISISFSFAQKLKSSDIEGDWQGILKQADGTNTKNYAYWISLNTKNDSVFGIARTEIANTEFYATIRIRGKINSTFVSFIEDRIINNEQRPSYTWCLIKGVLKFNSTDSTLSGNWSASDENCKTGSLLLYKSKKALNNTASVKNTYSQFDEVEQKLKNKESIKGYKIVLNNINFLTNSHTLAPGNEVDIEKIKKILTENENLHLNIQGHTDNIGDDDKNMKLSYLRAKELADRILKYGIERSRITYEGYGKSRPIDSNDTEEGRLKNRRVEIEITQ